MPRASSVRSKLRSAVAHAFGKAGSAGGGLSLRWGAMSGFFIDTVTGRVATRNQLTAAGVTGEQEEPALPWHPVQGAEDASTVIYALMRKQVSGRSRGAWIGTACIRHGEYKASLEADGWEEVPVDEIREFGPSRLS